MVFGFEKNYINIIFRIMINVILMVLILVFGMIFWELELVVFC